MEPLIIMGIFLFIGQGASLWMSWCALEATHPRRRASTTIAVSRWARRDEQSPDDLRRNGRYGRA